LKGKWKEDYDYVVYKKAFEKVIHLQRVRDLGHYGAR